VLEKDQQIKCVVLEVNAEERRVSLGIKQMTEDPWIHVIPEKYIPGHIIKGKIAKLTNFGAFVELEPELEGLLHISELADHKVDKAQDVVNLGEEVEVKILKVDTETRKIGLSLRRVQWAAEDQAKEAKKPTPVEQTGPYKDTFRIKLPSTASEEPAPEPESQAQDPTPADQTEETPEQDENG
jgi:small subunit ribosomal protein S1